MLLKLRQKARILGGFRKSSYLLIVVKITICSWKKSGEKIFRIRPKSVVIFTRIGVVLFREVWYNKVIGADKA